MQYDKNSQYLLLQFQNVILKLSYTNTYFDIIISSSSVFTKYVMLKTSWSILGLSKFCKKQINIKWVYIKLKMFNLSNINKTQR